MEKKPTKTQMTHVTHEEQVKTLFATITKVGIGTADLAAGARRFVFLDMVLADQFGNPNPIGPVRVVVRRLDDSRDIAQAFTEAADIAEGVQK